MKPRHKAALARRILTVLDRLTVRLEAQLDRHDQRMPYPPVRTFYLTKTQGGYNGYE